MQTLHVLSFLIILIFFFFQAEDGIRDGHVTGVQTCALPISADAETIKDTAVAQPLLAATSLLALSALTQRLGPVREWRSEERRVGKEGRGWWWPETDRKKKRRVESRRDSEGVMLYKRE